MTATTASLADTLRAIMQPLTGAARDYDAPLDLIGDARYVLIGEASHGTDEFYRERAAITRPLIAERGFTAVAVEADWSDACRVNRYVRGVDDDPDAATALDGFRRFPTWMWRNTVVRDFVAWLRVRNAALPPDAAKAGFYGLDLYSLYTSIEAVIGYLDAVDPEAARRARARYARFEHFGEDTRQYGFAAGFDLPASCEEAVVGQLGRTAAARRGLRAPGRAGGRGRILLRRAKCPPRAGRRRVLPHDVSRPGLLVEPARPPHDGHAGRARRAPGSGWRPDEGGRLGAQLAPRRRAPPRWAPGRSGMSANWCASGTRGTPRW